MSGLSSICPCDDLAFPATIANGPGQATIAYRVGDFVSFREALLRSRPCEVELANWRPGAQGDLAVQMVEWWAYLADILTFYNERIANEDYLRTADTPDSVQRLIRILGYRPRPGIGATGVLAATLTGTKALSLPQGFAFQSKPTPGKQPQIFELASDTTVSSPDGLDADPPPNPALLGSDGASVLLKGTVTAFAPGDKVLLLERGWAAADHNYAVVTVTGTAPEKDPGGNTNSRVSLDASPAQLATANAADYNLLRSKQTARLWQSTELGDVFYGTSAAGDGIMHLDSLSRQISVGDPILLDNLNATVVSRLVQVTSYSETIFYANSGGSPAQAPAPPAVPIATLHSVLGFRAADPVGDWIDNVNPQMLVVRSGWQSAATVIASPTSTLTGSVVQLEAPLPSALLPMVDRAVLIAGGDGTGVQAKATAGRDGTVLGLSAVSDPSATLTAPLRVLLDLLPVSRGKTVSGEVLGSGDATVTAGQEFTLSKSPLTYLQAASSNSGPDYSSTLRVWVNGVEWKEVASFYGQGAGAQVFITREDENNVTHVQFGDGMYGSRLPSGSNNVVASYRYGSGADSPDAGSLTVILKSWPGLQAVVNPVPVSGGADPDPADQIRSYAPNSVLTFGRAISADDYETIAAQAPGVARACSYFTWDAAQARMLVKVYVGDDGAAVASATAALSSSCDPNRTPRVLLATPVPISLSLILVVDPSYVSADVVTAATAALSDPDTGLLGIHAVRIGQSVWQSQIYAACLSVPGVKAVHGLQLTRKATFGHLLPVLLPRFGPVQPLIAGPLFRPVTRSSCQDFRADPGEGGFFQLAAADLQISPQVATYVS